MPTPGFDRLKQLLQELPGVGPKTSHTLALHIVNNRKKDWVKSLSEILVNIKDIGECKKCHHITDPGENICSICKDPKRDDTICCVVPNREVLMNMAKSRFGGVYFISGELEKLPVADINQTNIPHLLHRVKNKEFKTIVLAFSTTSSETLLTLMSHLESECMKGNLKKLEKINFGIPVGADLSNTDNLTIDEAMNSKNTIASASKNDEEDDIPF